MREFITYTLDKPEDVSGPYQGALIGPSGLERARCEQRLWGVWTVKIDAGRVKVRRQKVSHCYFVTIVRCSWGFERQSSPMMAARLAVVIVNTGCR